MSKVKIKYQIVVNHNGNYDQPSIYYCDNDKEELETVLKIARQEMYVSSISVEKIKTKEVLKNE